MFRKFSGIPGWKKQGMDFTVVMLFVKDQIVRIGLVCVLKWFSLCV